jgi:hypothetical protein
MTTAFCTSCALASTAANQAAAAEVSLSDLALKKTYLKIALQADTIALSGWKQVFSPTAITCPGTGGTCTARITLSVELSTFDKGESGNVACEVRRSGVILPLPPVPPGLIQHRFGDDSGNFQASVLTFSWVSRGLPLGATTFSVRCATVVSPVSIGGPVSAGQRTLTIDVYKP